VCMGPHVERGTLLGVWGAGRHTHCVNKGEGASLRRVFERL